MKIPQRKLNRVKNAQRKLCVNYNCYYCAVDFPLQNSVIYNKIFVHPFLRKTLTKTLKALGEGVNAARRAIQWVREDGSWKNIYLKMLHFNIHPVSTISALIFNGITSLFYSFRFDSRCVSVLFLSNCCFCSSLEHTHTDFTHVHTHALHGAHFFCVSFDAVHLTHRRT